MARVLIVANDIVASKMAGPGIRCLEIGRALAQAGNRVTIAGVSGTDLVDEPFRIIAQPSVTEMDALAREQDVVVLEGIALARYPSLRGLPLPLVVDLYDPFPLALLEQEAHRPLEQQLREHREIRKVLRELLRGGDFFLCASETQRDLWLGALLAEGRVNPKTWERDNSLRSLIDTVPFGLPAEPPGPTGGLGALALEGIEAGDTVLIWGGGIYNWFDPLTLIRAMGRAVADHPRLRLVFMSTGHPNPEVPPRMWMPGRARELSDQLGLTDRHVFFHSGWVPYQERGEWLLSATCGVSTHFDHAETRFSFRTRMLDYLWANLPIICTEGDRFAELVRERRLGWVVPPEDEVALAAAISAVAAGHGLAEIKRRVGELASEMSWASLVAPLVGYCQSPRRAADLPRQEWIHRRRPTALEIRLAEGWRLGRRAGFELAHSGPAGVTRAAGRWRRKRAVKGPDSGGS